MTKVIGVRYFKFFSFTREGVFLLLFIFVLAGCGTVPPQPSGKLQVSYGSLKGTVIDSDTKKPLSGAQVWLVGASYYNWLTNQDGHFEGSAEAGSYQLSVYQSGYKSFYQNISLEANETIDLGTISLEESGPPPPPFKI